MKFWPFGNKLETRDDSYTDTLIAALVSRAQGGQVVPSLYNAYYHANHGGPAVQYGYHPSSESSAWMYISNAFSMSGAAAMRRALAISSDSS